MVERARMQENWAGLGPGLTYKVRAAGSFILEYVFPDVLFFFSHTV